jgi:hypothetical protein
LASSASNSSSVIGLRGGGAPFAVLNGRPGTPSNGELISTTERNTSGRISALHAATGEPASCPTTAATSR